MDGRRAQGEVRTSGSSLTFRCWHCQCLVPDGQLRQRVVDTSPSRGTHEVTRETVSVLSHYELVNLCDACAMKLTAQARARQEAHARREVWWQQLGFGFCFIAMMLFVGHPLPHSLVLAWILSRLRVLGLAVVLMVVVFLGEYLVGLQPHRLHRRIRIPWDAVISGVLLWGLVHTETLQRWWRWLIRKPLRSQHNSPA